MLWISLAILAVLAFIAYALVRISDQIAGMIRALAVLAGQLADHKSEVTDLLRTIGDHTGRLAKRHYDADREELFDPPG